MAESGASASPSSVLERNVALGWPAAALGWPVAMADYGDYSSPCSPLQEMTPDRRLSEAMDTGVNVGAADSSPADESLNTGPNEFAVVKSLRDSANMGAKRMSVDESHHSEAVTPLQAPAPVEPPASKGLSESRTELLERVQALKKDLENWRGRLDTQVKSYREELGDLRTSLNSEVEQLRAEFQDLRSILKQQRELTSTKLAKLDETSKNAMNPESPLPTAKFSTPFDTEK